MSPWTGQQGGFAGRASHAVSHGLALWNIKLLQQTVATLSHSFDLVRIPEPETVSQCCKSNLVTDRRYEHKRTWYQQWYEHSRETLSGRHTAIPVPLEKPRELNSCDDDLCLGSHLRLGSELLRRPLSVVYLRDKTCSVQ